MEPMYEFKTRNFTVRATVSPEDMDPADSFEFQEDIEAVRSGAVEWFQVDVAVIYRGKVIATDSLGGCAYTTFREFFDGHRDADPLNRNSSIMRGQRGENVVICHYFPGMVKEAISRAREAWAPVRKTARLRGGRA